MHRRSFLQFASTIAMSSAMPRAQAQNKPRINPPALFENVRGGYRILPSGAVFSGATVAMAGHEIVHAVLKPWLPLKDAWGFIERHLGSLGRPVQALCGMELRIPRQLTAEGMRAFNAPYLDQLKKWDLLVGAYSAVCRTNVAPSVEAPPHAMVHAFSYSVPSTHRCATFCVSGAADMDANGRPVAEGDVSTAGMTARLQHVINTITGRLAEIDLDWSEVTHTDLCAAENITSLWQAKLAPLLTPAARHSVHVHPARPPIIGTEVELECRGVRHQVALR